MNLYSLSSIKLTLSFSFEFFCFQTVEMFHTFDMFQTLDNQWNVYFKFAHDQITNGFVNSIITFA